MTMYGLFNIDYEDSGYRSEELICVSSDSEALKNLFEMEISKTIPVYMKLINLEDEDSCEDHVYYVVKEVRVI